MEQDNQNNRLTESVEDEDDRDNIHILNSDGTARPARNLDIYGRRDDGNSSDEEEMIVRGEIEHKAAENLVSETDIVPNESMNEHEGSGSDDENMNEYVQLQECEMYDEDFGEFQTSGDIPIDIDRMIRLQLDDQATFMSSSMVLNHEERSFGNARAVIVEDSFTLNSEAVIESKTPSTVTNSTNVQAASHTSNQLNNQQNMKRQVPPSIPPLTQDKINTIKAAMAKFTLKAPSSSAASIADMIESAKLRVGDEVPK